MTSDTIKWITWRRRYERDEGNGGGGVLDDHKYSHMDCLAPQV